MILSLVPCFYYPVATLPCARARSIETMATIREARDEREEQAARPEPTPQEPAASSTPVAARKPEGLTEARGGKPDNLKEIKGVGPRLEQLLHRLGFFHFDHILPVPFNYGANFSKGDKHFFSQITATTNDLIFFFTITNNGQFQFICVWMGFYFNYFTNNNIVEIGTNIVHGFYFC